MTYNEMTSNAAISYEDITPEEIRPIAEKFGLGDHVIIREYNAFREKLGSGFKMFGNDPKDEFLRSFQTFLTSNQAWLD